jgi:hypothetical protein
VYQAQGTTEYAHGQEDDSIYVEYSQDDESVNAEMDIKTFDADGITFTMDDGDSAQSFFFAVVIQPGNIYTTSLAGEVTFAGTLTKQTNKGFAGAVTFAGAITSALYRMIQGFLRGMPNPAAYFRGYPNVDAAQEGYPNPTGDVEGGRKR